MKKVKIKYLKDLPGIKAGQIAETSAVDAALRLVKAGKAEIVEEAKADAPIEEAKADAPIEEVAPKSKK